LTLKKDTAEVIAPGATQVAFFPNADSTTVRDLLKSGVAKGESLKLQLEPEKGVEPRLHGILEVRYGDKRPTAWYAIDEPAALPTKPSTGSPPAKH
jgi:hypothetical protein